MLYLQRRALSDALQLTPNTLGLLRAPLLESEKAE